MKTLFTVLMITLLTACGGGGGGSPGSSNAVQAEAPFRGAHAQTAQPSDGPGLLAFTLGAQWPTGQFKFVNNCKMPNSGGVSCFYFPNGGKLRAVSWESSIKVAHDEVLLMLLMSPGYAFDGSTTLLSMHHNVGSAPSSNFKGVSLNGYVYIPPGYYVWLYGEGTVNAHPAGVEVQTTIYVEGVGVVGVGP